MATRAERARGGGQPRAIVAIAVVWVLLWDRVSIGNVLNGLIFGAVVTQLFPLPSIQYGGRPHPVALLAFAGRFLADLVRSSLQVVAIVLKPGPIPPSSVIEVRLHTRNELYETLIATVVSLVPGSTVVEARRAAGVLYVHVLGADDAAGREAARAKVLSVESWVVRALGSQDDIEACAKEAP